MQRAATETGGGRNPPGDPAQGAPPALPRRQSVSSLDGEKTAATLLFSGVFLALVGVIFTTMGWQHYLANPIFEWTQLLGPILISVGGTFILTSVCKFRIMSCWLCRRMDEEVLAILAMEQTSAGHSFMLHNINQPIVPQNATKMQRSPPVYSFRPQEVCQTIDFQPGRSVIGVHAAVPPPVYCVDGVAFTAEEGQSAETNHRRSRPERADDERGHDDDSSSTCSRPPAYEDIFPSLNRHNLTSAPPETCSEGHLSPADRSTVDASQ